MAALHPSTSMTSLPPSPTTRVHPSSRLSFVTGPPSRRPSESGASELSLTSEPTLPVESPERLDSPTEDEQMKPRGREDSNGSTSSYLTVPQPRGRTLSHPPTRSGTTDSTLLDPLFPRPGSLSRTLTMSTMSSDTPSTNTSPRHRTISDSTVKPHSTQRKGTTPARRLRLHTCTWDHELQHAIKIPLGRPIPPPSYGATTPTRSQTPAPVLGSGPLSDSGFRLVFEQLPNNASQHHHENGHKDRTIFGIVDVDLAAFAGKGRTTRRFLLKGSRTNATVKVSCQLVPADISCRLT